MDTTVGTRTIADVFAEPAANPYRCGGTAAHYISVAPVC
jgi:hypothetical protein